MFSISSVVTAILAIFTAVGSWFVEIVPILTAIFYAEGALTFMGALAVCSLAIGVVFLMIRLIQNFLRFRA